MYEEYDEHTQIKPVIVTKFPMRYDRFGTQYLDQFVELSPGLQWLKSKDALIITIQARSVTFYTDCKECLEEFKSRWTENVAIIPLNVFTASLDKMKDKMNHGEKIEDHEQGSNPTSLSQLRQKLMAGKDNEKDHSTKRAEDILKLIKKRKRGY